MTVHFIHHTPTEIDDSIQSYLPCVAFFAKDSKDKITAHSDAIPLFGVRKKISIPHLFHFCQKKL